MRNRVLLATLLAFVSTVFSLTPVTGCQIIDNSTDDRYFLANDLTGANVSAPLFGLACLKINSSNVDLDCGSFNITNNGTPSTSFAIAIDGTLSNVTIRNCVVSDYFYGIYAIDLQGGALENNTALGSNASGFQIDAGTGNLFDGNTALDNPGYGFAITADDTYFANNLGANNTIGLIFDPLSASAIVNQTLINNTMSNNQINFIVVGNGSALINNTAVNSSGIGYGGFDIRDSGFTLTGNTAINNSYGFHFTFGSGNHDLINNTASGADSCFRFDSTDSNDILGNNASDCGTAIDMAGSNNLIANNTADNSSYLVLATGSNYTVRGNYLSGAVMVSPAGYYLIFGSNFNVSDNVYNSSFTFGSGIGFNFDTADNVTAENNLGINGGLRLLTVDGAVVRNNSFAGGGIEAFAASNYSVINNSVSNATGACFSFSSPGDISDNLAYNCSIGYSYDGDNITIRDSIAHGCTFAGVLFQTYSNGSAVNLTSFNNSVGFYFNFASGNSIINSTAHGNLDDGVFISDSGGTAVQGVHFYNNSPDLRVSSFGNTSIEVADAIFDNPLGNLVNYTNLSLNDTLPAPSLSESYWMYWSPPPAASPSGNSSFAGKFLNISNLTGSPFTDDVSIDSIQWHWLDSELGPVSESGLSLWKYNDSGWSLMDGTPDTAGNTLSLANHSPGSVYAILAPTPPNCPVINSSGTYIMNNSFSGSPNPASPIAGTTCVQITSSDVTFDCDGFNITNDGTAGTTHGIAISGGLVNVTVINCEIRDYDTAIQALSLNDSTLRNNSLRDNSKGIVLSSSSNNSLSDNSIITAGSSAGNHGIRLISSSSNNTVANNTVSTNGSSSSNLGFSLETSSSGNNITNNTISANGTSGNHGINLLTSANDNTISGNRISTSGSSNGNDAIVLTSSLRNLVLGNNLTPSGVSDSHGVLLQTSSMNNAIVGNTIIAPKGVGVFLLDNSNHTNVSGNTILDSSTGISTQCGIASTSTGNNTISDNRVESNGTSGSNHGILMWVQTTCSLVNTTISRNNVTSTNGTGIYIIGANGTAISENNVTTSLFNHCLVLQSSAVSNNVTANLLQSCGAGGIVLVTQSDNNRVINNTVNIAGTAGLADGVVLSNSSNNTVHGNTVHNASDDGFAATFSSSNNTFSNNTAHDVVAECFEASTLSNSNSFTDNSAYGCGTRGYIVLNASGNNLTDNSVFGSSIGFHVISSATDTLLSDNTAFDNAGAGLRIENSNSTTIRNIHLFNNTPDLLATGTGAILNVSNAIFDNPLGNLQNYTNLSFNDTLASSYTIDHSAEPSTPPPGDSFAQKFVNISEVSGPVSIDSITWSWLDSELTGGDNESDFELWKFDGAGWTQASASPDTAANEFSLAGLSGFSVFGIIQNVSLNVTENLSVVKSDATPAQASPGGIVQFNITVNNTGTGPVVPDVTDLLPAGLAFLAASPAPSSVSGPEVNWTLAAIVPGGATLIWLNATVDAGIVDSGTPFLNLSNSVNASGASSFSNDSETVTVAYANISVAKSADNSTIGLLHFNITVANTGNVTLDPVRIEDFLDPGLAFDDASPFPTTVAGQNITWDNVGPLAPGATIIVFLDATVSANGTYTNNASVTGVPPNGANLSANASVTADASASPAAPPSDDDPSPAPVSLSIDVRSICGGSVVTVEGDGSPINGARVIVSQIAQDGSFIADVFDGSTNSSGEAALPECGAYYRIRASKSGYLTAVETETIACALCQQVLDCESDSDCAPNERCYSGSSDFTPQPPRFGPMSTYTLFPALANCIDSLVEEDDDPSEIIPRCGSLIPDTVYPVIEIVAAESTFSDFVPLCSEECSHHMDCRSGTCKHPAQDFDDVHLANGFCSSELSVSCLFNGACTDPQQFCTGGYCHEQRCVSDDQCFDGSYCEEVYGICVKGCQIGHQDGVCGIGSYCQIPEGTPKYEILECVPYDCPTGQYLLDSGGPAPQCVPGCQQKSDCESWQFCNITSGIVGVCQDHCGMFFGDQLVYPDPPWQCDPASPSNTACPGCAAGEICLTNHSCKAQGGPCIADSDCQPPSNSVCEQEPPASGTKLCVLYEMIPPNGSIRANEDATYQVFRNGRLCDGCRCDFAFGGNTTTVMSINGQCVITTGSSGGTVEATLYSKENGVSVQTTTNNLLTPEDEAYYDLWSSINNFMNTGVCAPSVIVASVSAMSLLLFRKRKDDGPPAGETGV